MEKQSKISKQYNHILDKYGASVFLQKFMNAAPITRIEGQRVIDADMVSRVEWKGTGVIVLHTA